jgi:hypothetical protein
LSDLASLAVTRTASALGRGGQRFPPSAHFLSAPPCKTLVYKSKKLLLLFNSQRPRKVSIHHDEKTKACLFVNLALQISFTEPDFVNFQGAQESIPRNLFRQPIGLAGRYDNPICRTRPQGYIGRLNRFLNRSS